MPEHSDQTSAKYYAGSLQAFNHPDWEGNSRLSTNPSRAFFSSTEYAPFGEDYNYGTGVSNFVFAFDGGTKMDMFLGMYDTPNRELHPVQGRWIQPDPAGLAAVDPSNPQTWNRYAYVGNNPLSNIDPLGLLMDPLCATNGTGCGGGGGDNDLSYGGTIYVEVDAPLPDNPSLDNFLWATYYGLGGMGTGNGSDGGVGGGGVGNGKATNHGNQPLLTPHQQKALHCLGQAAAQKGLSIALDVAGSIPGFGNLFSGAAEGIQALNAGYYGTVALASAGNTLLNPSASGAAFTGTSTALTVGSLVFQGSKVIPFVGTLVSLGSLAYDATKAVQAYQQCMAGPG